MRPFIFVVTTILWCSTVLAQESPHGKIAMECTDCHTTGSWTTLTSPMKFDHSNTSFKLYGQHRAISCRSCHTDLKFTGTPKNCYFCHQKDYDAAVAVDHRLAGFGTDCTQCHRVDGISWQSSFDHNITQFPTRGAHDAVPCLSCHVGNRYRGTPSECVACHQTEYNSTQEPNHSAAGYSVMCGTCHRSLTWQPAAFFPHPYFPIHAGNRHSPGVWNKCTDCHTADTPAGFQALACTTCHEHTHGRTDPQHSNVRGYVYQSSACYNCHPTGGG